MGSALTAQSDHKMNLESARNIERDAQYNAMQRRLAAERLAGEQAAGFGANNIELSGSAAQAMISDRAEAEIEAMNISYAGKFQAKELRQRSKSQMTNAYTGLATQAALAYVSGGGSLFAQGAGGTTTNATAGKGYYSENGSSSYVKGLV